MNDFLDQNSLFELFHFRWNVSRETFERLEIYHDLLLKWQSKINLISPSTVNDIWRRHILDSAQLFSFLPSLDGVMIDIGSGAGFPGLVLAIMGGRQIHLVESDHRKAAFLKEAARLTETSVMIHAERVENLASLYPETITARGCAPVLQLLNFSSRFFQKNTICLFLKGKNCTMELEEAREKWNFFLERCPSMTDPSGSLLILNTLIEKK